MENPFKQEKATQPFDKTSYAGESFYPQLRRVPDELLNAEMRDMLEDPEVDEAEIANRLQDIIEARSEAFTETHLYDSEFSKQVGDRQEAFFESLDELFNDKESLIGRGTTARVMSTEATNKVTGESTLLAIKYLTDPNPRTLSARRESAVLAEVERIKMIEEIENEAHLKHISVPHPYFHHQDTKIQCYGMQHIGGFDLEKDFSDIRDKATRQDLIKNLAELDIEEVEAEIETFFNRMHEYCLHGDIKAKNLMVDTDGKFYLIDFGQSVLVSDIPGSAREQLDTIREDETKLTKDVIRKIIKEAKSLVAE